MSREFTRDSVTKFLPAQFPWIWCKCRLRILSDQIKTSSRKLFTAHYARSNSDLNLTPVTGTTNGFIFQIINSLIESWGVRLTCFDCKNDGRQKQTDNLGPSALFTGVNNYLSAELSQKSAPFNAKRNGRPLLLWLLATERPAAILVGFVPSTRIFLAKAVYVVLGSSYLSAMKILALGTSTTLCI